MGQIENPELVSVGAQECRPGMGDQIKLVSGFLRRRYPSIVIGLLLSLPFGSSLLFLPRPADLCCVRYDAH